MLVEEGPIREDLESWARSCQCCLQMSQVKSGMSRLASRSRMRNRGEVKSGLKTQTRLWGSKEGQEWERAVRSACGASVGTDYKWDIRAISLPTWLLPLSVYITQPVLHTQWHRWAACSCCTCVRLLVPKKKTDSVSRTSDLSCAIACPLPSLAGSSQ